MMNQKLLPLTLLLAMGAHTSAAWGHADDKKSFEDLKASTKNFAHAKSRQLVTKPPTQAMRVKMNQVMPNFGVKDIYGKGYTRASFKGKMLLMFMADTQCPCVQALDARVLDLHKKYEKQGLKTVYVFSMPKEKPIQIARFMQSHKIPFPAFLDQKQNLLRMLDAQCSSELYLFDKNSKLRYHGRFDDSTFDPKAVKSRDLEKAIMALTKNQKVARPEVPAMGCAIPRLKS